MKEKLISISKPVEQWIGVQHEINQAIRADGDYNNNSMLVGISCDIAGKIGKLIVDDENDKRRVVFREFSIERPVEQWVDIQEELNNAIAKNPKYNEVSLIIEFHAQIADEISNLLIKE